MTVDLRAHHHVHFVGIGGSGMSALARFLLGKGFTVSGSDRSHGGQIAALRELGATVSIGHDAANLDGADLVVVTSAATEDNPEIQAAKDHRVPVIKRSELLAAIANAGRGIAVAGTHGKTTTSALIAHILERAGRDPTALLGGVSASLGSNARVGAGELIVAEADEYHASFLHLRPAIAVITNVEPEHLDFFGTAARVEEAFHQFACGARETVVVCADDPAALRAVERIPAPVVTYGLEGGDWLAQDVWYGDGATRFRVTHAGQERAYRSQISGLHNVQNATAAIAVTSLLDVPGDAIADGLASFAGVARRSERKGEAGGVLVLDDYAVHPTEVRVTIDTIRQRYGRPISVVFQPHTYSRTRDFLEEFARSFGGAERVYVMDVYAARETDTLGISGAMLAASIARHHPHVTYTPSHDDALDAVAKDARPGDLVLTMGAGDVYCLADALLERLDR